MNKHKSTAGELKKEQQQQMNIWIALRWRECSSLNLADHCTTLMFNHSGCSTLSAKKVLYMMKYAFEGMSHMWLIKFIQIYKGTYFVGLRISLDTEPHMY